MSSFFERFTSEQLNEMAKLFAALDENEGFEHLLSEIFDELSRRGEISKLSPEELRAAKDGISQRAEAMRLNQNITCVIILIKWRK